MLDRGTVFRSISSRVWRRSRPTLEQDGSPWGVRQPGVPRHEPTESVCGPAHDGSGPEFPGPGFDRMFFRSSRLEGALEAHGTTSIAFLEIEEI